jgi:hypothetical protein
MVKSLESPGGLSKLETNQILKIYMLCPKTETAYASLNYKQLLLFVGW